MTDRPKRDALINRIAGLERWATAMRDHLSATDNRLTEWITDLCRVAREVEALKQANSKEEPPCGRSSMPQSASSSLSSSVSLSLSPQPSSIPSATNAPVPEPGYVLLPKGDGHVVRWGERRWHPKGHPGWEPTVLGGGANDEAWYERPVSDERPEPPAPEHCSCHGGGDKSAVNRIDGIDYCGYCHLPLADPPAPAPQDDYGQVLLDDGVTKMPGMRVCGCGAEVPAGENRTMHCRHDAPPATESDSTTAGTEAPVPEPGYHLLPRGDGHVVQRGDRFWATQPNLCGWYSCISAVGRSSDSTVWYERPDPAPEPQEERFRGMPLEEIKKIADELLVLITKLTQKIG